MLTFHAYLVVLLLYITSNEQTRANQLTINVDNSFTLYFDGVITPVANSENCVAAGTVTLPSDLSVIAMQANNFDGPANIMAYDSDGYIYTNTSWKCTTILYNGWETMNYNDSSWLNAMLITNVSLCLIPPPENVSKIWDAGGYANDQTIYCRKALTTANQLTIYVDDTYTLYLDGVHTPLPNSDNCHANDIVTLPSDLSVIAMKANNNGGPAGIAVYDSYGYIQTNTSWKCTNILYNGWETTNYDDSSWPNAMLVNASMCMMPPPENVSKIWDAGGFTNNQTIYCRKALNIATTTVVTTPIPESTTKSIYDCTCTGTDFTGCNDERFPDTCDCSCYHLCLTDENSILERCCDPGRAYDIYTKLCEPIEDVDCSDRCGIMNNVTSWKKHNAKQSKQSDILTI